ELEPVKSSLCPDRNACPEVEGVGDEVRIREAGAPVVLKKGEENVLVGLIQGGRLSKLRAGRGAATEASPARPGLRFGPEVADGQREAASTAPGRLDGRERSLGSVFERRRGVVVEIGGGHRRVRSCG